MRIPGFPGKEQHSRQRLLWPKNAFGPGKGNLPPTLTTLWEVPARQQKREKEKKKKEKKMGSINLAPTVFPVAARDFTAFRSFILKTITLSPNPPCL